MSVKNFSFVSNNKKRKQKKKMIYKLVFENKKDIQPKIHVDKGEKKLRETYCKPRVPKIKRTGSFLNDSSYNAFWPSGVTSVESPELHTEKNCESKKKKVKRRTKKQLKRTRSRICYSRARDFKNHVYIPDPKNKIGTH